MPQDPAPGVTPERIVAYLDGELPASEASEVARAIADDPAAARMAAEMRAAAMAAAAAFAAVAEAPVPDRLGRLVNEPNVVPLRPRPRPSPWRRYAVAAVAAAFGAVVLASIELAPTTPPSVLRPASDGGSSPQLDGFTAALYGALDGASPGKTVEYGEPSPRAGGRITLLGELATQSGLACREFRAESHGAGGVAAQAGIACRRPDQGWDVLTEPRP
jgi:hypothetical protein